MSSTRTRAAATVLFLFGVLVGVLLFASPANAIPPLDPNGPPPSPAPTTYMPSSTQAPADRASEQPAPATTSSGDSTMRTIVVVGGIAAIVVGGLIGALAFVGRSTPRRAGVPVAARPAAPVPARVPAPAVVPARVPARGPVPAYGPVYRNTRVLAAVPSAR